MSTDEAGDRSAVRRRVVMTAYACGPNEGSEPGAGWALASAAAQHSEVWVLTRSRFRSSIDRELANDPQLARWLHPIYLELRRPLEKVKRRPADVYWYYPLWQRLAARTATTLHEAVQFNLAHHVTFASDWLPCGLTKLRDVPLVWGPVGGATSAPLSLFGWLGPRGVILELLRTCFTGIARRRWGDHAARRAAVVLALNPDVARRFQKARNVLIEPNSAIAAVERSADLDRSVSVQDRKAVYVGRLVSWKGLRIAIAALAEPVAVGWRLDIYGEGPDLKACTRLVARLGLAGRVRFLGQQPRQEILRAYESARVLLFPSMHDSAPWVVAEAISRGCPVICLDRGGPATLAQGHSSVIAAEGDVVEAVAIALGQPPARFPPSDRWSWQRLPSATNSWYATAEAGAPN